MRRLLLVVVGCAVVIPLALRAQPQGGAIPEIQTQLGDLLFAEARFAEAADAYGRAVAGAEGELAARAGSGLVISLLRTGDFARASAEAASLRTARPEHPLVIAAHGDALWAVGLFHEAEDAFEAALRLDPGQSRAMHGRARALAAKSRLADAMAAAQDALRADPREGEFHHTVGMIYERMHRYEEAAAAFGNYVNLLPNRDRSDKAAWARAEIRFLESFGGRQPYQLASAGSGPWRVPIRVVGDKVMIQARVNGGRPTEFVLDTGAEQTVLSRDLARSRGVAPITYRQSAGVGEAGLRGLQSGRIDLLEIGDLRVRHVPCVIKNPPLGGLPAREPESFSPLALGLSMHVDYARGLLVMGRGLPERTHETELALRMHRLAMVRGTVNGLHASFIVDTGGEVLSISDATADQIRPTQPFRRIPLRVFGTSGWDKDAHLLPFVDLEFASIRLERIPVVVLNLRAPSVLLGMQLGGILGHRFLSKYSVTIDLDRSRVGLKPA